MMIIVAVHRGYLIDLIDTNVSLNSANLFFSIVVSKTFIWRNLKFI